MTEFEPQAPASTIDRSEKRRNWYDVLFFAIICLALVSPWIGDWLVAHPSFGLSKPVTIAQVALPLPARPPRDPIEQLAVAAGQQGLIEVLDMHDSSAPPPVFDPKQIRVDHPSRNVWVTTGIASVAWQLLMAEPHLYTVEVYQICHIAAPACFKTRGVKIDSQVIMVPGPGNAF